MSPEFSHPADDEYLAALPEGGPIEFSGNPVLDKWLKKRSYNVLEDKYRQMIVKMPQYWEHLDNLNRWFGYSYSGWGDVGDITDQMNFYEHDTYQERRGVTYSDEEIKRMIVSLAHAKKQETDWAVFFGSPETPGSDVVNSLEAFWEWLDSVNVWYPNDSYKVGKIIFLMPSMLRPMVIGSTLKAIEQEPELADVAIEAFVKLKEKRDSYPEKQGRIHNGMLKDLHKLLYEVSHFEGESGDKSNLGKIYFLDRLTDHGLIGESAWYKVGVRERGKLPNFDYLEVLRSRLADAGDKVRPFNRRHETYYNDAIFFAERAISRMASTEGRNQQMAKALSEKLAAMKREGINSPRDFIALANTITPIVNHLSGEEPIGKLTKEVENMPQAFMRLLYITRDLKLGDEQAAEQEYEDEVYGDILSFTVSRATERHEQWYIGNMLRDQNESKVMLRYAWRDRTYRTGVHKWRKGNRGRTAFRY